MSKTIYKDPNRFYIYTFLREDGTPYYVGKGQGNRAWKKGRNLRPTDDSRISIIKDTLTETEAFDEEIRMIAFYGRKDLGTGILRNLTDGGEGTSGYKHTGKKLSPEHIANLSAANTGKHRSPESRAKMSAAKSGEKHNMYGKHPNQDTLDKMSAAQSGENNPNFGKVPSEETKAKRIATRARNKEARILASQI